MNETVADNAAQVSLLNEIDQTINDWKTKITQTINLRRKIDTAKTIDDIADLVGEARDKKYFDGFCNIMGEFMAEETELMEQRKLENEATVTQTFTLIALQIGLDIAINVSFGF